MYETFEERSFTATSLGLIDAANEVLDSYRAQGFDLSLRQLYYQLVSRNIIPNNQRSYKSLGNLISNARRAGLVDWSMLVDRGRPTYGEPPTTSPEEHLASLAASYSVNKWETQAWHLEVMVEKQALEGVLQPVCTKWQVNFTANKGYSSDSALYRMGKRLAYAHYEERKDVAILYLGDHDPSGLDMDRDIEERLELFSDVQLETRRLALTMGQIDEYGPPPNPAKLTDSRSDGYIAQFGAESWELDALEPRALADVLETAIAEHIDEDEWAAREEEEQIVRDRFQLLAEEWE